MGPEVMAPAQPDGGAQLSSTSSRCRQQSVTLPAMRSGSGVSMYIITGRQTAASSLGAACDRIREIPDATVCDRDGVICATTRRGLFKTCDSRGFPVRVVHVPSSTKP